MWPTLDRYNSAIHQPDLCFADAALRAGWPVRDRRGLPVPASGAWGGVYQILTQDRAWAVKCFTREVDEWRYNEVCAYLQAHPAPGLVWGDYLAPQGIMVGGRWFPILKMEWVGGQTLDRYLDAHHSDPLLVEGLAAAWVRVLGDLVARGIAHGDLQHGNILVDNDPYGQRLRLVDYDDMYVPALAGVDGMGTGLRDYQHPRRTARSFGPRLDNFAALVIYISLRALALQPALWGRYYTGENLLFSRKDYERPASSPLFADLYRLPDPRLSLLLDALHAACLNDDPGSLDPLPTLVPDAPALRAGPVLAAAPVLLRPPRPAVSGHDAAPDADLPIACPHCGEHNRLIARYCRGCGLTMLDFRF